LPPCYDTSEVRSEIKRSVTTTGVYRKRYAAPRAGSCQARIWLANAFSKGDGEFRA
jgi:hypothetical protein